MKGRALVTGAAQRLGRVIALELAASGLDIIIHYNRSEKQAQSLAKKIRALGRKAWLAPLDLEKTPLVKKFIPALVKKYGPLSVLVNNASLFLPDRMEKTGRRHKIINFDAPKILSESFYKQVPGRDGVIINLLDATPSEPAFSRYNASKKNLRALTLKQALRLAPHLRVNGVAPGPVLPNPRQTPEHFRKLVAATPRKSCITPDDIARTVRFLVENTSITGAIVPVDGGAHFKPKRSR